MFYICKTFIFYNSKTYLSRGFRKIFEINATKLKSAVKFFCKSLFKLREIWYNVGIEDLAPKDHILRKIDKYINFSFINDLCRPYYCENNGRPAIEPEIMFKMLFIGYLFGIRSETRLVEDVKVNIAYRWFLGYGIEDKI